jgi:urease accessory protein
MLTCSKLISGGQGLAKALIKRAPSVSLDWDVRQKSRFQVEDSSGRVLSVFLQRGHVVRGGDVLVADDGSWIRIEAAPQALLRITTCPQHGTPFDLIRAAYHLGNRHVPIELKPDHLQIEPDAVLADMLRSMHLIVNKVDEAFEPEGGAYGAHHGGSGHSHDDGHDHAHAPASQHAHEHGHEHTHVHGPNCKHDH